MAHPIDKPLKRGPITCVENSLRSATFKGIVYMNSVKPIILPLENGYGFTRSVGERIA